MVPLKAVAAAKLVAVPKRAKLLQQKLEENLPRLHKRLQLKKLVNLAVLMKILTLLNLPKIVPRNMMSLIPRENRMTAKRLVFLRVTM